MVNNPLWVVPRIWNSETCFIIAGGPSVREQKLSLLNGKRVIVVNSSWEAFPSAEYLFFADWEWWMQYWKKLKPFSNAIVTCSRTVRNTVSDPRVKCLDKIKPPAPNTAAFKTWGGIADNPRKVFVRNTSLTGAINLAVHLGSSRIVLLGADMQRDEKGRSHHHGPHLRGKASTGNWNLMMEDLRMMIDPLAQRGISVINTSPLSRIDWWTKMRLEDCI
jgi:hypothetical protein